MFNYRCLDCQFPPTVFPMLIARASNLPPFGFIVIGKSRMEKCLPENQGNRIMVSSSTSISDEYPTVISSLPQRERSAVQANAFIAVWFHVRSPFPHCFFKASAPPWVPRSTTAAAAGPLYSSLSKLIQKKSFMNCAGSAPGLRPAARLQPEEFFRRARGRLHRTFGEHPAAAVRFCVCSSKLVVLLFGCLFVCTCVCLFVCLCVCVIVCWFVSSVLGFIR